MSFQLFAFFAERSKELKCCREKITEDKMKYRARARGGGSWYPAFSSTASMVPPRPGGWGYHRSCAGKMRSLAFDYAEYYVSFDAEVLFAFLVPD